MLIITITAFIMLFILSEDINYHTVNKSPNRAERKRKKSTIL